MHEALSVGRVHGGKGVLRGYFDGYGCGFMEGEGNEKGGEDEDGDKYDEEGLGEEKRERVKQGKKEWKRPVVIEKPTGQHIRTMGKTGKGGGLWLLPEEVVYLVERGSLDVRYRACDSPTREEDQDGGGPQEWNDVSMSLQACYAWFMGMDGLSLERYSVYAGLRRSGYIVLRAPGWYEEDQEERESGSQAVTRQGQQRGQKEQILSIWQWIHKQFLERRHRDPPPLGPLVGPGLYRSYSMPLALISQIFLIASAYAR